MQLLFDYNRTLFNPETGALYPGAFEMLRSVSATHTLILVSRFEPKRESLFESLEIRNFFASVHFVPQKTRELFSSLLDTSSVCMVIGDSVQDEISIGNALGAVTVRVTSGAFGAVSPSNSDDVAQHTIATISELPSILALYEKH